MNSFDFAFAPGVGYKMDMVSHCLYSGLMSLKYFKVGWREGRGESGREIGAGGWWGGWRDGEGKEGRHGGEVWRHGGMEGGMERRHGGQRMLEGLMGVLGRELEGGRPQSTDPL